MGIKEDYLIRLDRLLNLLESDEKEIEQALQGDLLDVYRNIITIEKDVLRNALKMAQRFM